MTKEEYAAHNLEIVYLQTTNTLNTVKQTLTTALAYPTSKLTQQKINEAIDNINESLNKYENIIDLLNRICTIGIKNLSRIEYDFLIHASTDIATMDDIVAVDKEHMLGWFEDIKEEIGK